MGFWSRFHRILLRPLTGRSRVLLALAVLPLLLSFFWPLWQIHFWAPQYPEGLDLDIYAYTIEGGREGADLMEINVLNHYIGMLSLDRKTLSDLDWIPFALGALIVFCLRVAAIGDVRSLVDLTVMALYFCAFSAARFVYMLYTYGHNLDPRAPVTMEGFMPPIMGSQQVANFVITSLPGFATAWIGLFVATLLVLSASYTLLPMLRSEESPA